jgi:hypothetical protein
MERGEMTERSYGFLVDLPAGADTTPERLRELALALWEAAFPSQEGSEPLVMRFGSGPSFVALGDGRSVVGHVSEEAGCISIALFSWDGLEAQAAAKAAGGFFAAGVIAGSEA